MQKEMVSAYLTDNIHQKAKQIEQKQVQKFKIKWWTEDNKVDSGVMVMRHMECFKGQAQNVWDCGIEKDQKQQKATLSKLRSKYVTKILESDVNIHGKKVKDEGLEFEKLSAPEQKELLKNAAEKKTERFKMLPEF